MMSIILICGIPASTGGWPIELVHHCHPPMEFRACSEVPALSKSKAVFVYILHRKHPNTLKVCETEGLLRAGHVKGAVI